MIRVAVIATTPMALAGLQAMLLSPEMDIIVSSTSVEDTFDLVDAIVTTEYQKVDLIARSLHDTRAMALVVVSDDEESTFTVLHDLDLHGWSILPSSASSAQLRAAVLSSVQGLITYPTHLLGRLSHNKMTTIKALDLKLGNSSVTDETLTPREREVLELVGQGLSNKLIARSLHISDHTVKFHISSITTKLGASRRTDAVRLGLRKGFITL